MRKADYISLMVDLIAVALIPGCFILCGIAALITFLIN
jgi:hypothetical protein